MRFNNDSNLTKQNMADKAATTLEYNYDKFMMIGENAIRAGLIKSVILCV